MGFRRASNIFGITLILLLIAFQGSLLAAPTQQQMLEHVGPNSLATQNAEADTECQELWDKYGGFFSERDFTTLTGCFTSAEGEWYFAVSSSDPRLIDGPILSADETELVSDARKELTAQINALFSDDYCLGEFTIDRINGLTGSVKRPIRGYRNDGTQGFHVDYFDALNRCMQSPEYQLSNNYIVWLYDRKLAAFPPSVCERLVPPQCAVLEDVFQFGWAPWPWDLTDEINLDTYLKERVLPLLAPARANNDNSASESQPGIQTVQIVTVDGDGNRLPGACYMTSESGRIPFCDNELNDLNPSEGSVVFEFPDFVRTVEVREIQPPIGYEKSGLIQTEVLNGRSTTLVFVHDDE
jgi:hypothetical protein